MKKTLFTMAAVFAVSPFAGLAQDAASSPTPGTPPPPPPHERRGDRMGGPGGGPFREALEALTPAERQQFMDAMKKAEGDADVKAAQEKVKEAMKAAMEARKAALLKADPTIGPILEKLEAAKKDRPGRPEGRPDRRQEKQDKKTS